MNSKTRTEALARKGCEEERAACMLANGSTAPLPFSPERFNEIYNARQTGKVHRHAANYMHGTQAFIDGMRPRSRTLEMFIASESAVLGTAMVDQIVSELDAEHCSCVCHTAGTFRPTTCGECCALHMQEDDMWNGWLLLLVLIGLGTIAWLIIDAWRRLV